MARATGRKKLGGADWFKAVSRALVQSQNRNGYWTGSYSYEASTALAILTLINGHRARAE